MKLPKRPRLSRPLSLSEKRGLTADLVAKVIRTQAPDKEGRVISPEVQSGSYSISDKEHILGRTLFEGKLTVDKTFGHASYGCGNCCDPTNPWLSPNPFSSGVGGSWWNPQSSGTVVTAACEVSAVNANSINSSCTMQVETAQTSLSSPPPNNPTYSNPTLQATSDNTVTIVSGPTISPYSTSNQIISTLTFQTNLGGRIYWTYTAVCDGARITRSGTQVISCPN